MGQLLHPATRALASVARASDAAARLDCQLLAFEWLLRVDALVLAAAFIESDVRDDKVRNLLLKSRLHLGDWHALLQTLAAVMGQAANDPLRDWFAELERGCVAKQHDDCKASPFQTLLWIRNQRAHSVRRVDSDFIDQSGLIASCCLSRLLTSHPPLGEFQEGDDGRLAYRTEVASYSCWPFLVSGALGGVADAVFVYRANSTRVFEYDTAEGGCFASRDIHDAVLALLRHRYAAEERLPSTTSPYVLRERLAEAASEAVDQLAQAGRFQRESYVTRGEADAVYNAFCSGTMPLLIVDGPAGAGKTSWLCALAERRVAAEAVVVFAPVEQLAGVLFPEVLGDSLRVQGEFGTALQRLTAVSSDSQVIVLIDDLAAHGRGHEAIGSLIAWARRLTTPASVKILVTIRSEELAPIRASQSLAWEVGLVSSFPMPPLRAGELLLLAEALPVSSAPEPQLLRAQRREVARRLGAFRDSYVRRPGLAASILGVTGTVLRLPGRELAEREGDPSPLLSAEAVYAEIIRRDVQKLDEDGRPVAPLRLSLLRSIAARMLELQKTEVSLDDLGVLTERLVERRSGLRSADYNALLGSQVLAERIDYFEPRVGFVNPQFFGYIGALSLAGRTDPISILSGVLERVEAFPPALVVAAFLAAHVQREFGPEETWQALAHMPESAIALLRQLATLEPTTFLQLLGCLSEQRPAEAVGVLTWLVDNGEPRLACRAAQVLIERVKPQEARKAVRLQHARARYEMDEYAEAAGELTALGDFSLFHTRALLGEIAVARGRWEEARGAYEAALKEASEPEWRAHALRGLGFVSFKTSEYQRAEQELRQALEVVAVAPDSRVAAEAWSDLAEVLAATGRTDAAEECLHESLRINRKNRCVAGIGVVESILGQLHLLAGRYEQANLHLVSALDIARLTENRYREAFVLARLGRLKLETKEEEEGARLITLSARLYEEIGGQED